MATEMKTSEKLNTCLDYIDHRLEQTIQIAETIIDDIKTLTQGYTEAVKNHQLVEHAQQVRDTQMKWVNQLHDIILEQTNRDLNGIPFDLPSVVARQQPNQFEYLDQDEIELLMEHEATYSNISTSRH